MVLNLINSQGNVNQSHNGILLYTHLTSKNSSLTKVSVVKNAEQWELSYYCGSAIWYNHLNIWSYLLKMHNFYNPAILLLDKTHPTETNAHKHQDRGIMSWQHCL